MKEKKKRGAFRPGDPLANVHKGRCVAFDVVPRKNNM